MADELGLHACSTVELFFEWQNYQHTIDVFLYGFHAMRTPRPDLWADVVSYSKFQPAQPPRKPEIEVRPVDKDDSRGLSCNRGGNEFPIGSVESPEGSGYFKYADDAYIAHIDQRLDTRGAHLAAARSEEIKLEVRVKPL